MGDTIFLFLKAVNHFCTVDYNLHLPGDAGVLLPTYNKVVDLLSKRSLNMDVPRVPVTDLPVGILPETFTYEDVLNFHKSKQVQFKYFRSKHPILHSSNLQENRKIERQISETDGQKRQWRNVYYGCDRQRRSPRSKYERG